MHVFVLLFLPSLAYLMQQEMKKTSMLELKRQRSRQVCLTTSTFFLRCVSPEYIGKLYQPACKYIEHIKHREYFYNFMKEQHTFFFGSIVYLPVMNAKNNST